jgi:hypothetical protein
MPGGAGKISSDSIFNSIMGGADCVKKKNLLKARQGKVGRA